MNSNYIGDTNTMFQEYTNKKTGKKEVTKFIYSLQNPNTHSIMITLIGNYLELEELYKK